MTELLQYFKSSELVLKVQNFFGVTATGVDEGPDKKKYKIGNKFFYYLFLLGTELGDELFYGISIPFMFYNVDCYLGRRMVFHWFISMYIGQALKEIFRVERPKSPAIPMQNKWSNEYSLPSTHAMGSLSMAGSIVYFSVDRYGLNPWIGMLLIILWVTTISLSRVYLGMHSVLDIIMGAFLTIAFLLLFLPPTDYFLDFISQTKIGPIFSVVLPVILVVLFPLADVWTPTRGDTCSIVSVFSGIEFGVWVNYQLGLHENLDQNYPLGLEFGNFFIFIARTVVGLALAGGIEFLGKFSSYAVLSAIIGEDRKALKESENSLENSKKNFVDLTSKFVTYSVLGFCVLVIAPQIFELMHINRERFYAEF